MYGGLLGLLSSELAKTLGDGSQGATLNVFRPPGTKFAKLHPNELRGWATLGPQYRAKSLNPIRERFRKRFSNCTQIHKEALGGLQGVKCRPDWTNYTRVMALKLA